MSPQAKPVIIDLLEAGCAIALSPGLDQLTLSPETRAVIESTPLDAAGIGFRSLLLPRAEAEALLEFFLTAGSFFSLHGNGEKSRACGEAVDNIRHGLWLAS